MQSELLQHLVVLAGVASTNSGEEVIPVDEVPVEGTGEQLGTDARVVAQQTQGPTGKAVPTHMGPGWPWGQWSREHLLVPHHLIWGYQVSRVVLWLLGPWDMW